MLVQSGEAKIGLLHLSNRYKTTFIIWIWNETWIFNKIYIAQALKENIAMNYCCTINVNTPQPQKPILIMV